MVKYFCDACEKEISTRADEWFAVSAKDKRREIVFFSNRQEILLCKECFEKMLKVIDDGKEKNDGKL